MQCQVPYARVIANPDDVAELLRTSIGNAQQERVLILGLDARRRIQLVRTIAQGSFAACQVQPRAVFAPLIGEGLASCLLAYNRPVGPAELSDEDILLTQRLAEVGRLLRIPVLDHVVVTRTGILSLSEQGLLHH